MNKKLLKIGSTILSFVITVITAAHISVVAQGNSVVYSGQTAPSFYTDSGSFSVKDGIQDGRWYFNSENGVLDVYGTGSTGYTGAPWFQANQPWKKHRTEIKEIIFHEGITDISNQAVGHASNIDYVHPNLEKVTLPSTVTYIAYGAFSNCTNLKEVIYENGIETINQSAFYNTAIENLNLPNSLKTIGNGAFQKCSLLKNIKFGNGIEKIDINAFNECNELESVSALPESLNYIGLNAFRASSTSKLKNITFLGALPTIGGGSAPKDFEKVFIIAYM